MKRIIIFLLYTAFFAAVSMAIPAKRGFITYVQPDGSEVRIRMVGDGHGHALFSEEGSLLIENDGILEYAAFDEEGLPIPSGLQVSDLKDDLTSVRKLQTGNQISRWLETLDANKFMRVSGSGLGRMTLENLTRSDAEGSDGISRAESAGDVIFSENFGRNSQAFPASGRQKGLVILVEYEDVKFSKGDHDYFSRMLNEEGFSDFGSRGSARDWFVENSGGLFLPEFDVYGPVSLPYQRSYYGANDSYGNDKNPHQMAIQACELLDDNVDFSQYDRDGDGVIDNVFVFYAGIGEHDSGVANTVWPHSWNISSAISGKEFIFDGVKLEYYACSCEFPYDYTRPDGIGTFVHEFSHVLGLPDLYVTNTSSGFTPGQWDVLDTGPYNNDGLTPPNYSSYEKCALGWIDCLPLRPGKIELPDLGSSNIAYVLPTEKSDEFFFIENRQRIGNDKFLPGHGMLVWHVDFKRSIWDENVVNNKSSHQHVDLIEADNVKTEATRSGDSFPGFGNVTAFGFSSAPALASWAGQPLAFDLSNISESADGMISFDAVPQDNSGVGPIIPAENEHNHADQYFDLFGRKVLNPGKGIYILNGKKILR